MKKLFSLLVPILALFLTLSPQPAKAVVINPDTVTNKCPFTIYLKDASSASGYYSRFEIKYDGDWTGATKPIFQFRILNQDGTVFESDKNDGWKDASTYGTLVQMKGTASNTTNYTDTKFIFTAPMKSTSYPSGMGISFRLKSGSTWNVNKTHWITFKFRYQSTAKDLGLTGNIMSLVSNNFANVTEIPTAECFYKLFSDDTSTSNNINIECNNLLLPATALKDNCYEDMFSGCAGFLKKGPNIMAFNPESDCTSACFKNMFSGCSAMTTLTTNFLTWGSGSGTENWLYGCSACKTVNCPSTLPTTTDASHIGTAYTSGAGNVSPRVYVFNVSENSGTWNGTCQADKYYTTAAPTVPDPNEDGFTGWYTEPTGGSAVTPSLLSAPLNVTKYYAQFSSATTFNVAIASYNSDYGTVTVAYNDGVSNQTLTSGNVDILNATTLTITAVPNAGYKLTALTITPSGGVASNFTSGNTHTLTAAITVTATFAAKSFTLAINSTSHGSITCSDGTYVQGAAAQPIAVGTTVTFTATPDSHYELTGWTGAVSGTGLEKSLTVTGSMDEALTVGATFALEQFTINATSANLSMGNVTGGGTYSYDAAVTLTATANDHYRFVEWSDGNTSNPRNFTAFENLNLTATFGLESTDKTVKVYQGATADTTKILYALTAKTVGGTTYTPIDLGYGIAWSDKNMGATDQKPAGKYYAWGDLSSGTSFDHNTYYNNDSETAKGFANGTALPDDHDAAKQTIGSYWHIPSPAQWTALLNNCSVSSYTYTGANGNSITLPATGYYNTNGGSVSELSNTTHYYYWTNTKGFYSDTKGNNSGIIFEDGAINGNGVWEYDGRLGNGLAIRPVYVPTFTIYTLTINVGSYKYVYKCQSGQSITVNACATELGATFNEWSEDHNTNATRTFTVTGNATYTATFTTAPTYSLAWSSSGSAPAGGTAAGSYIAGTTINAPTTSKTGYTFSKWRDETNSVDFNGTMPNNNVTYTAQWNAINYTITYNGLNDVSNISNPASYTIESSAIVLANPGIRTGYTFTGWKDDDNSNAAVTQIAAGSTGNRHFTANWTLNNNVVLPDNTDNSELLAIYNGHPANVTIGRTFYADGNWGTVCLPFNLSIAGTAFDGAEVRTMSNAYIYDKGGENEKLIIECDESTSTTTLTAGRPYIIRFAEGDNIVNPTFNGVTISVTSAGYVEGTDLNFNGLLAPQALATDGSNLFLGGNNTLYKPSPSSATVNAFRAYFGYKDGLSQYPRRSMMVFDKGAQMPTDVEIVTPEDKPLDGKRIENGQLVIYRNGLRYNVAGQLLD